MVVSTRRQVFSAAVKNLCGNLQYKERFSRSGCQQDKARSFKKEPSPILLEALESVNAGRLGCSSVLCAAVNTPNCEVHAAIPMKTLLELHFW
jgi:hypothetical protein